MPSRKHLMKRPSEATRAWAVDPLTAAGLAIATAFAGGIGGLLWAGLVGTLSLVFLAHTRRQALQGDHARIQQENLSHFLLGGGNAEEMAAIRGAGDIAEKNLVDFLTALRETYGGESLRGTARISSEEQTEPVAPGITFTLSHDLGWWYGKLVLSGETGRGFLHGEYTQWKGRGKTPQEAIDIVMKRCGTARQQRMIQEYATKLLADNE